MRFVWVKGHAGNAANEKVDELARTYAGDCRSHVREGYLPLEGWQSLLASEYSRGTDVPEDARMLMDGAISAAEYHMGRGQGDSAHDRHRRFRCRYRQFQQQHQLRLIASMLAEPEGVSHDLMDFGQTTDDDADDAVETTVLETELRKPPQCLRPKHEGHTRIQLPGRGRSSRTDESGEPDESGKTDESGEPHQSYAQMLVKPNYFPREGDENDKPVTGNADGTDTDSTAVPQNANESHSESQDDEESAPEQAASSQSQDLPKLPHRPSPSGLSVSGTVRFTHRNPARPSTAIHVSSVGISPWKAM